MQREYVQVVTTVASQEDAERLARHVLAARLAACVQVDGPLTSFYHWQGKVEKDQEYRLHIKSRADLFTALVAEIKSIHSYDTPEILALPVLAGSQEYLAWLDEELNLSHD